MHHLTRQLLAVLLLAVMAQTVAAESRVYLVEYRFDWPLLWHMTLDGDDVHLDDLTIPQNDWLPVGVQVDKANGKIYWTHGSFNDGRIRRADLNGDNREVLLGNLTNPRGLALDVDDNWMYWSDTQDNRIYRAHLDGSGMETVIDRGNQLGRPHLDLGSAKLYYGDFGSGEVRRANLDGTGDELIYAGVYTPNDVAVDVGAGRVYWVDSNTSFVSNHIARCNMDGSGFEVIYQGLGVSSGLQNIELDLGTGTIYWCDEIEAIEKGIWRANLDGSDLQKIHSTTDGWNAGAIDLVLDDAGCPEDLNGDGTIDQSDLGLLLASYEVDDGGDIDGDGDTDQADLGALLAVYDTDCN